jgi:Protein of unknown function (DUF982)
MTFDMDRRIPTIILCLDGKRNRKAVRTVREAAQLLLADWPADDGEEFFAAIRTCLEVLTGESEPEILHAAIVHAAREAGIAVATTDCELGVLRIHPVVAAVRTSPRRNIVSTQTHRLSPSGRRRRQRHWSGRSQ